MDSRHSHLNWAADLGGVSFPLLADFHPKGAVAKSLGVYLEEAGITDRATVIIDREGVVQHASSVGPSGQRDIQELLRLATDVSRKAGPYERVQRRARCDLAPGATLYVREGCRFCASVLRVAQSLRCTNGMRIRDVNKDPGARAELDQIAGAGAKVPVLVENGKPLRESSEIIKELARRFAHY